MLQHRCGVNDIKVTVWQLLRVRYNLEVTVCFENVLLPVGIDFDCPLSTACVNPHMDTVPHPPKFRYGRLDINSMRIGAVCVQRRTSLAKFHFVMPRTEDKPNLHP